MLAQRPRRDAIFLVSLLTVIAFFLTRVLQGPRAADTRGGLVTVTTRALGTSKARGAEGQKRRPRVPDLFRLDPRPGQQRAGAASKAAFSGATFSALSKQVRRLPELVGGGGEGGAGPQRPPPDVPPDFSWRTYLLYHPELAEQGVTSEALAKEHYAAKGRAEGRVYRRLRVIIRYTACTGLINQHYSHIAAFSLAAVLGAELVLAPAVKRDSFAHYFSVFKEQNEVSWTPADLSTLLDVDAIVAFWGERGLRVHKTPALLPFPDLTQPEVAFPLYPQPELDPRLITRLEGVYLQSLDLGELVEAARAAVVGHAGALLAATPPQDPPYIVLDLPCTFFMLRSLSNLRVMGEVARSLKFAPAIEALADRVEAAMTGGSQAPFNAVHLRIEKDARDWAIIMGGDQVIWHNYVQAMKAAGFSKDVGLYVASGLLTYGANEEMEHLTGTLREFGLCSEVHYKERYLPQDVLQGLNSEQKALVDFLVLARGRAFVGFGSSTFSFYLREFRVLSGLARSSSVLVDSSVIGTDPLFNAAGTVV